MPSLVRYSHMRPADYGKFVRVATDTDAGTAVHKDAPVYDPSLQTSTQAASLQLMLPITYPLQTRSIQYSTS